MSGRGNRGLEIGDRGGIVLLQIGAHAQNVVKSRSLVLLSLFPLGRREIGTRARCVLQQCEAIVGIRVHLLQLCVLVEVVHTGMLNDRAGEDIPDVIALGIGLKRAFSVDDCLLVVTGAVGSVGGHAQKNHLELGVGKVG